MGPNSSHPSYPVHTLHTSMNDFAERQRILQRITSVALQVKDHTSSFRRCTDTHSHSNQVTIPPLEFPCLTDVIESIRPLYLPENFERRFLAKITQWVLQTQQIHNQKYERSCRDLLKILRPGSKDIAETFDKLRRTHQTLYITRYLPWIKSQILAVCPASHNAMRKQDTTKKRVPFNTEYTPLLEKYFEYNAYPSAPDRQVLARKSMMTPRQIEVWFQNHRTRTRRDGGLLRRLSRDPLPINISLDSLDNDMPCFTVPKCERGLERDADGEHPDTEQKLAQSEPITVNQILNPSSPPHAFPTIFSRASTYDPFPTGESLFKFPPPPWFRYPATKRVQDEKPVNFDDFILAFVTKLNLRDGSAISLPPRLADAGTRRPSLAVTSIAPHPALIRPRFNFVLGPLSQQPPATPNHHSPSSRSRAAIVPSARSKKTIPRVVENLPKYSIATQRCPRAGMPVEPSPKRSTVPGSRSSSTSSSASSSSSDITTPPSSPMSNNKIHFADPSSWFLTDLHRPLDLCGNLQLFKQPTQVAARPFELELLPWVQAHS